MIDLLIDTNVLIHLLHPTGNAEAGLTRQLLDWDRAGYVRICVPAVSGHEQGRSSDLLATEMNALGLTHDCLIEQPAADDMLAQINRTLGHHKQGDKVDALIVHAALNWAQQGHEAWLVTGDRNILRHTEILQAIFGTLPIISLRSAVNQLKVDFPLTIIKEFVVK